MSANAHESKPPGEGCGATGLGAEHETIARFVGSWRAEVKLWLDPGGPPNVSTGTMSNTLVLGGRFLQQDYHDDAGVFLGKGFWGYNDVDRRYEGFWIDVMSNMFQIEYGTHDPRCDVYIMKGSITNPSTGKPMGKRSVITVKGRDAHEVVMYFQQEGAAESKVMEIHYRRA